MLFFWVHVEIKKGKRTTENPDSIIGEGVETLYGFLFKVIESVFVFFKSGVLEPIFLGLKKVILLVWALPLVSRTRSLIIGTFPSVSLEKGEYRSQYWKNIAEGSKDDSVDKI